MKGRQKGVPFYAVVISEVWHKRGSDWKLVHYQGTGVK
jgi:hypothetical protein